MGVKEAATYLTERGYRCSAGTVRALAKAGMLPRFRPGVSGRGSYSFHPEQLDRFLRQAERGGTPEPAAGQGQGGGDPAARPAPAPRPRKARAKTPAGSGVSKADRLAALDAERRA